MERWKNDRAGLAALCALALALLTALAGSARAPPRVAFFVAAAPAGGALAAAAGAAPALVEALVRVESIDIASMVARVNVTVAGAAGQRHLLGGLGGGGGGGSGGERAQLLLNIGGALSRALPWPLPAGGRGAAAGGAAALPLEELVGRRLVPFDKYALPLAPLSATLSVCDDDDDDDDDDGDGSGAGSREGGEAGSVATDADAAECTRLALPLRVTFDFGGVSGGWRAAAAAAGAPQRRDATAAAAAASALVLTRATSQRVLRLMGQLIHWAVAAAVAARCAGAALSFFLLRRLMRVRYVV